MFDILIEVCLLPQLQNDTHEPSKLDQASGEWQKLSEEYVNMATTRLGLYHVQQGEPHRAIELWRMASKSGFAGAHFNLGLSFETGHGVDQDFKKVNSF